MARDGCRPAWCAYYEVAGVGVLSNPFEVVISTNIGFSVLATIAHSVGPVMYLKTFSKYFVRSLGDEFGQNYWKSISMLYLV